MITRMVAVINDPVASGIVIIVGGAIVTVILFKFLPWAITQKLEDIIIPAVKQAVHSEMKAIRMRVGTLEDWRKQMLKENGDRERRD